MIPSDVLGYVLAGGESSRMQRPGLPRDKALLLLNGETLLQRALAALARVCPGPSILCGTAERCSRFQEVGPTVPDRVGMAGPLGGLDAALHDARQRGAAWVLITPVDLPWMSSGILGAFLRRAQLSAASVACMHAGSRIEPLPVVLRTEAAPLLAAALKAGERKLMPVLRVVAESCGAQSGMLLVDSNEIALTAGFGRDCFRNVNTPEDFEAATVDETLRSGLHQSKHGG